MRNQYKVLAEKYYTICETKDVTLGRHGPFGDFVYQKSVYNLAIDIKDWPHAKYFVDWLVNESETYSDDILEHSEAETTIEAACEFFDNMAQNYVDYYGYHKSKEARDQITSMVSDAYSDFIGEWWPKEQARLAALNKDNPGIEMDI